MEFEYQEEKDTTQCIAYRGEDICCECPSEIRNNCPLLIAISNNYVYPMAEKLTMKSCSLLSMLKEYGLKTEEIVDEDDEEAT